MARKSDARLRALLTAENLFRKQGFAATGLTQILEESGAPKGSFYHYFPDGKGQMAEEAVAAYGSRAESLIRALAAQARGDAGQFVRRLATMLGQEMQVSEWTLGCLLANLSTELVPGNPLWSERLEAIERKWRTAIVDGLVGCGIAAEHAATSSQAFLSGLLGARALSRMQRSAAPFEAVGEAMVLSLRGLGYEVATPHSRTSP